MPVLVECTIDDARYGLPLERVVEVAPRVAIARLPGAPSPVVGIVRHRGDMAVAIDLRTRLGHPPRPPSLDDHLVVARTARRLVALVVDRVERVRDVDDAAIRPPAVRAPHVRGVVELEDGLLVIEDLDAVLSLDEEAAIDDALAQGAP